MKLNKSSKPTNKDKAWEKKIEKQVEIEKVELNHPKGKETFEQTIRNALKKKLR